MSEIELKFRVEPGAIAALEAELLRRGASRVALEAIYFDTFDGRLDAGHCSLRLRREGVTWMQTLKAAGDTPARRAEHEVELPTPVASSELRKGVPVLDLRRHEGSDAYRRLHDLLDGDPAAERWVETFRTRVQRLRCEIDVDGSTVEAAFDEGVVLSGDRSAPICELELELKSGDSAALIALARLWAAHAGLRLSSVSKAERGARLMRHEAFGAAVKARPVPLRRRMPAHDAVRAIVASCLTQVLANASDVADGCTAEEPIHQLRVGLRRLRTALHELGPIDAALNARADDAPLATAFRALGATRDETAVAGTVGQWLQRAGAPRASWTRAEAVVDPAAAVRDAGFQGALLELIGYTLTTHGAADAESATGFRSHVMARLQRLHRQVTHDGRRFERLPEAEQHHLRKRLKRLRYLAEFVAPVFDRHAVERYLARLEPAQDALGRHVDTIVAIGRFRDEAARDAGALWSVGWLQRHLDTTAHDCAKALGRVARASCFWSKPG